MIELASDNHIAELAVLPKSEQKNAEKWGSINTISEFKELVESGFVIHGEETALWACYHEFRIYTGNNVEDWYDLDFEKPDWATHVYWYGK